MKDVFAKWRDENMLILALESSTTSAKAMLYDTVTGKSEIRIKNYPPMYEDSSQHDAEKVFLATVEAGRELAAGREISMISLGTTWHSIMLCDCEMKPVSPVYLWSYTGASALCRELRADENIVNEYYQKTGCMVNAIYPFFKLMHLKRSYDLQQFYLMGQGSYMTWRLTGQRIVTECMASGSGLLNVHTKTWSKELFDFLGIKQNQVSQLVDYTKTYALTEEGARLLGIKSGVPVIAANSDGGLNQVGVGALKKGIMTFSVGTSGALRVSADHPVLPKDHSVWCYLSPKGWLSGAATSGCCNCVDWFRNKIGEGRDYAQLEGTDADRRSPVFLPHLFGERCPGWKDESLGTFAGLEPQHDIRDLYRAVQEGVLFQLYQCYQTLVEQNGVPEKIKISGGILRSQTWRQMCADIFQTEMEVDRMEQASLQGGIVLAMELLGIIPAAELYEEKAAEILIPDKSKQKLYAEKYERYLSYYNG